MDGNRNNLPVIDKTLCIGCGACIEICLTHAITEAGDRPVLLSTDDCTFCGKCEVNCPADAISVPFTISWAE